MKKIIGLIVFMLACVYGHGQYPVKQSMGSKATEVYSKGILRADSGYVQTVFPDTVTANLGYIKNIAGITIRVADTVYFRNAATTKWLAFYSVANGVFGSGSNWSLTGNASTTVGTNFIGTTDDKGLMFKTNGVQSGYLDRVRNNTSFGVSSLLANTTGQLNVAVGLGALSGNTTGTNNIAIGADAHSSNTTGSNNIAIGLEALAGHSTHDGNIHIGNLGSLGIVGGNTVIGYNAANLAPGGGLASTAIGANAQVTAPNHIVLGGIVGSENTRVSIGATEPSGSALLELASITDGLLIPRMTTAERNAIILKVNSLMIFNTTTNQFEWYKTATTSWEAIGGGGGGVSSLSAIASTPNANGATITGSALNLEPASASFGGVVTTGAQTFAGVKTFPTPVFTTSAQTPLLIGGTGTTSTLTLQSTSGAGTTGSDIIFKDDNTEFMRIKNSGSIGIGTSAPDSYTGGLPAPFLVNYGGGISLASSTGYNAFYRSGTDLRMYTVGGGGVLLENADLGVLAGRLVVGTTPGSMAASARAQIESTTQGLLIPRMTTTQRNAISSPATGLQVYDNTLNLLYFYNGSAWTAVGATVTASNGLTKTGNDIRLGGDVTITTDISGNSGVDFSIGAEEGFGTITLQSEYNTIINGGGRLYMYAEDSIIMQDGIGTASRPRNLMLTIDTLTGRVLRQAIGGSSADSIYFNQKQFDPTTTGTIANPVSLISSLENFYTDVANSGTAETDLYSYTVPALQLAATGEKLTGRFSGEMDNVGTNTVRIYFAGTEIFEFAEIMTTDSRWVAEFTIYRTGASTARCEAHIGSNTFIDVVHTDLTGLTFSGTNILKITGQNTSASDNVRAKTGTIKWERAD